ncbi:golgin subfamily A member 7-like [Branchiostoma floridae]|uniref:Ras modification protein ERF4 n=1 Tax=Branchiostoma floridae TaxID=7739 RepID=C3XZT7_BRAFL|nr:golgin subfamily A member 7-like [Branchiostoma floridae]|eukprot:XP_002610475.1 hypothetical protein BRAFLDRAFT_124276 [Branchiostoma floridae]
MAEAHRMDDVARTPPAAPNIQKVFIQRDFSEGTGCKFQSKFPPELEGRIERTAFEATITRINELFGEAERVGGATYCEGCMGCLTAYLIYLCIDTHYEKVLKRIARHIQEQNENIYIPRGLQLVDPIERGLRVLEIVIYDSPVGR